MFSRYPDEKSRKKKQDERAPNPGPGLGTANIHLKCNRSDMNSRHFRPAKTPLPSTRCRRMSDSIFKERSGYERSGYAFASSRRETPEFKYQTCPSKDRGRREGRVLGSHPWPVCIGRKHTVVTTGGAGSSGLPCAMVLTGSFVLFPATSSFLSPSLRGLMAPRTRSGRSTPPRKLSISNGCQNHTTSPSATSPLVSRARIAHDRIALRLRLRARRCRVHRIPSQRP